jgi:hypothetical protein
MGQILPTYTGRTEDAWIGERTPPNEFALWPAEPDRDAIHRPLLAGGTGTR